MSLEWYKKHGWDAKETAGFVKWFERYYGVASQYEHDVDEYWVRRAFALMGWNARRVQERG